MISDTPRMKAAQMAAMEHMTGDVYRVGCDIEQQLNAANVELEEKRKDIVWLATEKAKLEDRIHRAAMAFFRDGSDGQVASQMLQILEEERRKL
jgi:hypothetical protein